MKTPHFSGVALVVTLAACGGPSAESKLTNQNTTTTQFDEKQSVRALLKSIETGDKEASSVIDPNHYMQHDLAVKDGLNGFREVIAQLPKGSASVSTARVFQDVDFVFAHSSYDFFGPKIGFDVFRFDHGKIVEHWDNLQPKPAGTNPSGHSMIDGPTEGAELDKTDANKALVQSFVDDILVNGRLEKLASYFDGDAYVQHNPQIGDGLSGLSTALKSLADQGITLKYDHVHRVLGEGNFVLCISEGAFMGVNSAFYDLFRLAKASSPNTGTLLKLSRQRISGRMTMGNSSFRSCRGGVRGAQLRVLSYTVGIVMI